MRGSVRRARRALIVQADDAPLPCTEDAGRPLGTHARKAFEGFPDELRTIRGQGLGFFRYTLTPLGQANLERFGGDAHLDRWIDSGWVRAEPILYEDFLPFSAAGIFRSNLGEEAIAPVHTRNSASAQAAFETALGAPVLDEFKIYEAEEAASLKALHASRDAALVAAACAPSSDTAGFTWTDSQSNARYLASCG
ncbi:MAG TPA: DUF1338 family protein [Ramlibacter sp.]|nr:DUF1338 family protein [Ramlibacter sp.]